jgi:branched-chain amino acid transport system substrate-binding protein
MRVRTRRIGVIVFAVSALVVAGCGQKPGVGQLYGPGGQALGVPGAQGAVPGVEGAIPGAEGTVPGVDGSVPGAEVDGTGTDSGAGTDSGTDSGTGDTSKKASGRTKATEAASSGPVDRTGVTDSTIKIGIHAPVTGAAAFPQRSFENAVGVYASYINSKGGIHGRKLEVLFRDDGFNPNQARAVCKDLAQQQKVFLIIGGAGSDQIDSCARYAASVGVPYISAGVHETRPNLGSLNALRTYYAVSLTYEQQAPMITKLVKDQFGGQKVGLMVASNDSLNSYFGVQKGSLSKAFGGNLAFAERVPKNIQSEAPTIAAKICNSGAKAVVWNASPSGLINVTKAMTCSVRFVGPGNTNGLNIVATGGCPQLDNAQFFSSFPQLDKINSMDPNFAPAYRKKNGSEPDDIGIATWGIEKLVSQMMEAAGKDLSRQSLMAVLGSGKTFDNGVNPAVKFGGNKHFGGTGMHLLRADCGSRQFRTEQVNVRP